MGGDQERSGRPSLDHRAPMSPSTPEFNPVEQGLHDLGRQIDEAHRAARRSRWRRSDASGGPAHAAPRTRSRHRRLWWVAGSLVTVVVVLVGAVAGYAWYLNSQIHRIDLKNLTSAPVKGADAGTENILMIGSTSRCALKVQNPAYGLCSQGVNGVNSDVVMILHLNPATHALSILRSRVTSSSRTPELRAPTRSTPRSTKGRTN